MSNTLHHKLATMLDVVYPEADTGVLADQLLETMGLAWDTSAPPAHRFSPTARTTVFPLWIIWRSMNPMATGQTSSE